MGSTKDHLIESNMSYIYHCKHGIINGTRLLLGALASYIHSFIPPLFPRYSIMTVLSLYHEIKKRHHIQKIERQYLSELRQKS
jgi:hypothetical protein